MTHRVRRLLAIGPVRGAVDQLEQVLKEVPGDGADAVAVVGDLCAVFSKVDTYRAIFRALGHAGRPAYWVPGPLDAPISDYLRESANVEIAYPFLHGVHGTLSLAPGHTVVAGMGGEIDDDPNSARVEETYLRYPSWEAEYRLKVVRELDEHPLVLLLATPPAHKGRHEAGSEALAELVKTYNPRVAVVAADDPHDERLGRTLVVSPGRLDRGHYAIVDLQALTVEPGTLLGQVAGDRR
jgi:uncharacterized protein